MKDKAFREARKKRFIAYIKEGWTLPDIMDREGMDYRTALEMRKEVRSEKKLTGPPEQGRGASHGFLAQSSSDPHRTIASNLSNKLYELKQKRPHDEVSFLLGLNNAEQNRAVDRKHNWTLAQINRFAELEKKSFTVFMTEILAKPKIGFS